MDILNLPLNEYGDGVIHFGPLLISNQMRLLAIKIARCTSFHPDVWNSQVQEISLAIHVSYDSGVSYQNKQFIMHAQGGIDTYKGIEMQETVAFFGVHPQRPTHIHGDITIHNGPIRTSFLIAVL